jgi:hypothetical protein
MVRNSTTVRAGMLAVPSRVAARLPHLSKHDVAETDAEIRAALAIANGMMFGEAHGRHGSVQKTECGEMESGMTISATDATWRRRRSRSAAVFICAAFWGGMNTTQASSEDATKARPSCFGAQDCKEHPDYVPFGTAGTAMSGTQAQPSASASPQPFPTREPIQNQDIKFATNAISVRSCDAQADAIVEKLGSDYRRQGVDASSLRAATRNLCLIIEQEMYEKVRYTLPVVPSETANACAIVMAREQPPSYETMSKCLDKALTRLNALPSGSASLHQPAPTPPTPSAYTRGLAALDGGDFDAAIAEFTAAIADDPKDTFSYIRRGTAYEKKGDAASAISDYRKVQKLVDADTGAEYAAKIRKLEKTKK